MKKILLLFTLNAVYAAQNPNTSQISDENTNKLTCWCVEEDDPGNDIFDENGNFIGCGKKKSILPLYDRNILDVNIATINYLYQENMNLPVIINYTSKLMPIIDFFKKAHEEALFLDMNTGPRLKASIQVPIIQSNEVIKQVQNHQKIQPLTQKDDALLATIEKGVERLKNEHEQDEKNEERDKKDNHAIEQVSAVEENFSPLIDKKGFYFQLSYTRMSDDNTKQCQDHYYCEVLGVEENKHQVVLCFKQQPLRRMDYGPRFRDADTFLFFDINQRCFTEDKIKGKLTGANQVKNIMKAEFDTKAIERTDRFDTKWAKDYYEADSKRDPSEQANLSFKSKNYFVYNKLEEKGTYTTALGTVLPILSLTYSNQAFK